MPDSIETKRRFDARDLSYIAEFISDELGRRKRERKDRELQWDDIDRQIAMEPDASYKKTKQGKAIPEKAWMSEMEMPLQAQTLEVLVADARRMMFPDAGPWFLSHALATDEYYERVNFKALIAGDQNNVPSELNQDNADKLVDGWLAHIHGQYEFSDHVNRINAESFKYGVGVGRVRNVSKSVYIDTARGVLRRDRRFPVLFPHSIRNVYLDDTAQRAMNEGLVLGPAEIFRWTQKIADIKLAAQKGSGDPYNENGGWMPAKLKGIEGNNKGEVEVIEYEGDLVVPRATVRSIFIPNAIVTVIHGVKGSKTEAVVVRLRFRKHPFSSYIRFPYHNEDAYSPYAASPLLKGRPVQLGASQAFSRLMDGAALLVEPPIGWDPTDMHFAAEGGPSVFPGAKWKTTSEINIPYIPDVSALLQAFLSMKAMYDDVTGVNAPRLGAQTVSHTTAFAKEAELSRGTVRTVDYVRDTLRGPMTTLLHMEYEMSRAEMSGEHTFYIDAYRGWVTVRKSDLPDMAKFEAFGSGGPAEQRERTALRMSAMQQAIQIDVLRIQAGMPPNLNYDEIQKQIMLEGGWADVDPFLNSASPTNAPGIAGQQGMEGTGPLPPGTATAAIQAISQQG